MALLIILVLLVFAIWIKKRLFPFKLNVPGISLLGIIGNLRSLRVFSTNDVIKSQVLQLQARLGYSQMYAKERMFRISWGLKPIVAIFNPEAFEVILKNQKSCDKALFYNFLHPWLGSGLLTSSGNCWKTRRKLLTPAFHNRILDNSLPLINEHSMILVEKIHQLCLKDWVDISPLATLCALDIICETAMGVKINAQRDSEAVYVRSISKIANATMERVLRFWLWPDFMFRLSSTGKRFYENVELLHNFTRKVIRERKKEVMPIFARDRAVFSDDEDSDADNKPCMAFLDLLLRQHLNDDSFTEEDIRMEVDTFMFAGHDTTAMLISWAIYLIGLYPEVQLKLEQEQSTIFGGDSSTVVTYNNLKKMHYLECVLKETLRLFPSVPTITRELREDLTVDSYRIPKGSICSLNIMALHRSSASFPEPEVFDPDRFRSSNSIGRHRFAYLPFSAGPRNCIGQKFAMIEAKTVVSAVLRNFTLKSLEPRDKVLYFSEILLRPEKELKINFIPKRCTNM